MQEELGPQLRRERERQKLSLRAVASAVGISPSLLSQVETGKTHPSVSTLYALVNHLHLSLDDLLGTRSFRSAAESAPAAAASPLDGVVQRAADNPVIEMENGVRWERLAVGRTDIVDPLVTTYAPGASSSTEQKLMRHSGIEYAYLLEGELTLKLDFESTVIRAGDSICFDSSRPHLYINEGSVDAKGLWFVVGRREYSQHAADGSAGVVRAASRMGSAVDVLEAMEQFTPPPGH